MSTPALRVAFRADASLDIGTGHVMRCLTLADALRERGAQCLFISRAHPGNLLAQIRQRGFEALELPTLANSRAEAQPAHAAWLGCRWEDDAQQTLQALTDRPQDWLVVDHYALDARWEQTMRPHATKLLVIDDLADRAHDCDVLLDQNLGRKTEDYATLVRENCGLLIGPAYALLRPEFAVTRQHSVARRAQPQLRHILITMGGVDKANITGRVLDALSDCALPPDCRITIVMGAQAPALNSVRRQATTLQWPTEVAVSVNNMATLMAESDLAIGAAGSTSWERCCLALPTLLFTIADNQKEAAQALASRQAVRLVELNEHLPASLKQEIDRLRTAPELLRHMSTSASAITDGEGVARVLSTLH
jgi:UDP-2,4-diacetamido-2,4,6-trideoxy-beta-L-altropyranose hydrolase